MQDISMQVDKDLQFHQFDRFYEHVDFEES
jgi:hypothetical protein